MTRLTNQGLPMNNYGCTEKYLTKNDAPWFPIMGEMHYSRYPEAFWRESLLKMKSLGVEVVSSYVIWIHHEEIEGSYDFSGCRNLRKFVETVRDCGLTFFIRIGPWSHAEVRNGGFPDWLLRKEFSPRTNDPAYFTAVEQYYRRIGEEVHGLMHRDGGPIIGVQIENEYGHCGGLSGPEGEEHMKTLTAIARSAGFDVPYWTATGWGGAVTGGLLPVMGGYCEAPWDQRLTDIEPSGNYIFTHERNDHNIGSDFGFGTGITFDIARFPYLTAELGGGLQVTAHRRPVATADDIGAMTLAKLGSGVNLLGYYMYHGGTNPAGKRTTLQESRATGSINDLPELSYDFRAPIREYGQVSETARELKLYAYFAHSFGKGLCRMDAHIPDGNPLRPTDAASLRHSWRHDGDSGFLFINNYQRRQTQADHAGVVLAAPIPDGPVFPSLTIQNGEYFFLPFNMPVGSARLKTALVTPLCVVPGEKPLYVFYTAFEQAEKHRTAGEYSRLYQFDNDAWPEDADILTLSKTEAREAWIVADRLIVGEGCVMDDGHGEVCCKRSPGPAIQCSPICPDTGSTDQSVKRWLVSVPSWTADDCFVKIRWEGNTARLRENGVLVADDLCPGAGHEWEIGMKRFGSGRAHDFILEITPLHENAGVFLESWPPMENGTACRVCSVSSELEFIEDAFSGTP